MQKHIYWLFFLVKHELVSDCDHIDIFQFFCDSNQQQHKFLNTWKFGNFMDNDFEVLMQNEDIHLKSILELFSKRICKQWRYSSAFSTYFSP